MGKSKRQAQIIRKEYYLSDSIDLGTLEDICFSRDAYVDYKYISGAQGRILFLENSDKAFITVNSEIIYERKTKFVLAHEFGHFLLHKGKRTNFICTDDDFSKWGNVEQKLEAQANEFAAELLVPSERLLELTKETQPDSITVQNLSKHFGVSFTSTAISLARRGAIPCYIVYSEDERVKWFIRSDNLYLGDMYSGKPLPKTSKAYKYHKMGDKGAKEVCLASKWFPDNSKQDLYLYEDCFYIDGLNHTVTILFECNDYN